jgi:hypothetical protein
MKIEYLTPSKKIPIGIYRSAKKRNTKRAVETNGIDWIRIYHDDIDGGFDFELPIGMVRELFSKLKKQWQNDKAGK